MTVSKVMHLALNKVLKFYLAKTALPLFVINVVMRQRQRGFNSIFSALSQNPEMQRTVGYVDQR
ncbi:MAG: hypothetical protein ACXV8U_14255, partial [Methylobacter sp.]